MVGRIFVRLLVQMGLSAAASIRKRPGVLLAAFLGAFALTKIAAVRSPVASRPPERLAESADAVPTSGSSDCAAPAGLAATAAFATEISLRWANRATAAADLSIQRSTDNVSFSTIAAVASTATTFTDSHVIGSTTYYYRVSCSTSAASNVASARTTIPIVTDAYAVFAEPNVSKPKYLTVWKDPVFKTRITRISADPGTAFRTQNRGAGVWSRDARHNYQLVQPWSADGALYMLENRTEDGGQNGAASSLIYLSGTDFRPALGPPSNSVGGDRRWNPNRAYASQVIAADNSTNRLWWFDVSANLVTRIWSLPFTPAYLGNTKGHVSRNGRFVVLIDNAMTKLVAVDMDPQPPYAPYPNRRIGPVYNLERTISGVAYAPDGVGVDPLGRYAVVHYSGDHLRVYDIDPVTLSLKLRNMPPTVVQCTGKASDDWIYSLGHHDLSINPYDNNEPVAVGQEHCGNVERNVAGVKTVNANGIGHVVMVRLRDGAVTSLTDPGNSGGVPREAYAHHVSGQNRLLPGWVFVSYGAWPGQQNYRYYDELVALSMDGKQRVQRLAHLHSDFENDTTNNCASSDSDFNYRSESHGVPSPEGKRAIFASNWLVQGNGTGNCSIQDYFVDLR